MPDDKLAAFYESLKTLGTPYFDDGGGRVIYHADCREVLPKLPSGCVDLVLTDPPYGINHPTNYSVRGRENLARCRNYIPVFGDDQPFQPEGTLSLGLPTILWGGNHYASRLPDSSGWLVWDKLRPDDLDQSTCELAWTNVVKGVRRFAYRWHGMLRAGDDPISHPTQKPEALMRWCMSLRWTEGFQTILDQFLGGGTTLRAAKDLGRFAIGVEIEEKYCEIAARRLAQQVLAFGNEECS